MLRCFLVLLAEDAEKYSSQAEEYNEEKSKFYTLELRKFAFLLYRWFRYLRSATACELIPAKVLCYAIILHQNMSIPDLAKFIGEDKKNLSEITGITDI